MTAAQRVWCSCLGALLSTAAAIAQTAAPPPGFATGDVGDLSCKVLEVGGDAGARQLVVEVKNGGRLSAEPITFRIEQRTRKGKAPLVETFHRVRMPRARRYGRPVLAGGKRRYWLATQLDGKRRELSITVTQASFHDGDAVPRPQGVVLGIEQVQATSLVGTFPISRVRLKNPFDRPLDALFLVELVQPRDTVELFGVRIAAGAEMEWDLHTRPGRAVYLDATGAPACTMKARELELVDWVLVAPPDEPASRELFSGAYRGWQRWPEGVPALTGHFEHRQRRQRVNTTDEYDDAASRGTFTVRADGDVRIEFDGAARSDAKPAIERAFGDLLRRPEQDVVRQNRMAMVAGDRVELQGPGFSLAAQNRAHRGSGGATPGTGDDLWYEIADGRVVGRGVGELWHERWQTRAFGSGYVVSARDNGSGQVERFVYAEHAGSCVPVRWSETVTFGERLFRDDVLTLRDCRPLDRGAVTTTAVTGDGADRLRAVWQAMARVPQEPLRIRAQIEVRSPGTDDLWLGHERVRGEVTLLGIGRSCTELRFTGQKRLAPDLERALAAAIYDRFLLWFGQDLNDRPPFDVFFKGARVDAPVDSVFAVHDAAVTAVHVADGRIVRLQFATGDAREFRYGRVGDRDVVTEVRTGEAVMKVELAEVDGHLLPARLRFERSLGDDWGPETITLRRVRVER